MARRNALTTDELDSLIALLQQVAHPDAEELERRVTEARNYPQLPFAHVVSHNGWLLGIDEDGRTWRLEGANAEWAPLKF